jgi:hypothetical protein
MKARLYRNRQMNLYAFYADKFRKYYRLTEYSFGGCIYWVTTKSSAKQRQSESYNDYVMRLADLTNSVPFYIEASKMDPKGAYVRHMELYERSLALRQGEEPKKNYDYCFSYFQPCPYFSQCNGGCFTELNDD